MTTPERQLADDIAQHSAWMRRLARALVGDAAADDVVQETWTKLGERRERPGYLATVVRSLALRHRRGERRRAQREQRHAAHDPASAAADVAARSEVVRRLAEAVERLAEPFRTTIVLRYYDDLSSAEIARRVGVPAATVRARLMRGLDALRVRLDANGGGRERWLGALAPWVRFDTTPTASAGTALALLAAMKTMLLALIAVSALVLAWIAFVPSPPAPGPGIAGGDRGARVAARADVSGPGGRDGSAPQRQAVAAGEPPDAATNAAAAMPTVTLAARAIDVRRQVLGNAWLCLRGLPSARTASSLDGALRLEVARDEFARLAALGDRGVEIEVGAVGHQRRTVHATAPNGTTGPVVQLGDVVLEAGGSVHGRVVDSRGQGVDGAAVAFGRPTSQPPDDEAAARHGPYDLHPEPYETWEAAITGTSGPGGEFHLDGVPVGYGTVWARTATGLWSHTNGIGVRAGEAVTGLELVVHDTADATITGRITDPDGRPLPGVAVCCRSERSDRQVRTDAHGAFHFAPTPPIPHDLLVGATRADWEPIERRGVAPGTHGLVLCFSPCSWLRVAVRDPDGTAVRSGRVSGVAAEGPVDGDLARCEGELDEHGEARIRRPAEPLRVRVRAPGYHDGTAGPFAPAAFPEVLEIVLERAPAIVGRVWLPNGEPAGGAVVSLHRAADRSGLRPPGDDTAAAPAHLTHQGWGGDREPFVYALFTQATVRATADANGAFRLSLPAVDGSERGAEGPPGGGLGATRAPASPPVRWHVHAALPGFATVTSSAREFDPTHDAQIELRLPSGGAIAGQLELADGASPAGWTAYASDGLAEIVGAPVAADGAFTFANLHPGGWQVRVFEPGHYSPRGGGNMFTERVPVPDVQVDSGSTVRYQHTARPRCCARLLGRLRIDGEAPGPAFVSVHTSTPVAAIKHYSCTLDPDGCFALSIEPGLDTWVDVQIPGANGLSIASQPVIVPGANEWSIEFTTAKLAGAFSPPTPLEQPLRAQLSYATQIGVFTVSASWEPTTDGRFGPIRVAAGHGTLRGPRPSFREQPPVLGELDLAAGETRDLGPLR